MMYLPPGAFSEDKLIEFLLECPIEREVSGAIESFCDRYTVSSENRAVFERFLASRSLDNRVMALEALIFHGGFGGYEADCVLLHYQARLDPSSQVIFDAISCLRKLSDRGSIVASRVLALLDEDQFVKRMWGG